MAISFPSNPNLNDTHVVGNVTWTWNGSSWTALAINTASDVNLIGDLIFEGATVDDFETTLTVTDPTADNTITFQNASGTVAFLSDIVGGGGGIALTDLSVGAEDPASGDGGISYDNTTGVFTYAPPDLSLYQPVGNLNADIDGHLNTSTATANQILSWDGADYAWVADQTGAGSSYTDADVATYLNGNLDSHIFQTLMQHMTLVVLNIKLDTYF